MLLSWASPKNWEDQNLAQELQAYCARNKKRHNVYQELSRAVKRGLLSGTKTEIEMLADGAHLRNFGPAKQGELRSFLQSRKHNGPFE